MSYFLFFSFFFGLFPKQNAENSTHKTQTFATLTISVENCKSNKGKLFVALYDKEKGFLKENLAIKKKIFAVQKGKTEVSFENLPLGKYAFALFHDENNNTKLDKNFLGIPTEGYGFSNDARGTMSAPSFAKSAFEITKNTHYCKVNLSY